MNRPTGLLAAIALLSVSSPASSTSEPEAPAESVTIEVTSSGLDQALPNPGDLLVYDQTDHGIPVTARYPDIMQVSASASGEGIGVLFTFRPQGDELDGARVHIFLPAASTSAEEQESFATRANRLVARNGWTRIAGQEASSSRFREKWVQVVVDFKAEQGESGNILLGALEGRMIQVILLYPDSLAEIYWAAALTILETFAIKPSSATPRAEASRNDDEAATDSAAPRYAPD